MREVKKFHGNPLLGGLPVINPGMCESRETKESFLSGDQIAFPRNAELHP